MRDILFRGKSIGDLGTWIYGYYYYDNATEQHCILDKDTLYKYDVIPETVGQNTGWKDHEDNPIFEGDRIEIEWGADSTCEVISYSEQYGYFMYGNNPICELTEGSVDVKVVGTIYDYPEIADNEQQDN